MVLAVRLNKHDELSLKIVSKKEHLKKSQAAKELIKRGFIMYQLDQYKAGNISIGKMAELLDMPVIEALSLVGSYNAHPKIPKDFLSEASETASKLFA